MRYRVYDIRRNQLIYPEDEERYHDEADNRCPFYFMLTPTGKVLCNDFIVFNDWSDNYIASFSLGMEVNGKELFDGDICSAIIKTDGSGIKIKGEVQMYENMWTLYVKNNILEQHLKFKEVELIDIIGNKFVK